MRVQIYDELVAISSIYMRVVNDELVQSWFQKDAKRIMCIRLLLVRRVLVMYALRLINGMDLENLILVAFLIKELVPSFQSFKDAHLLDPFVGLAFYEFVDILLYLLRLLGRFNKVRAH